MTAKIKMQSKTYKELITTAKITLMTFPAVYPFSSIIFPPNQNANP